MLTRRHIRVKVLQSIYAFNHSAHQDLEKQEKFLLYSMDQMHDLYVLLLQLLVALRDHAEGHMLKSQQKHLATSEEKDPSKNFINNRVFQLIDESPQLKEVLSNKKLNYWIQDNEYLAILFNELRALDWYKEYLKEPNPDFKTDRAFVVRLFKEVIAPNEKVYEYIEDKRLTWLDDYPIVNTALVKVLSKISEGNATQILVPDLYKDVEDKDYALQLLRKVLLTETELNGEIEGKTPNWDKERIADIDMIILKMGISEFLHFPSIPVRATINEYLEISKEYSTPKSSIFINGILDKLVKDYTSANKLNKIGRGLR